MGQDFIVARLGKSRPAGWENLTAGRDTTRNGLPRLRLGALPAGQAFIRLFRGRHCQLNIVLGWKAWRAYNFVCDERAHKNVNI
jgi:hypothetical protein